jgi:AraC family transcriptional regulator
LTAHRCPEVSRHFALGSFQFRRSRIQKLPNFVALIEARRPTPAPRPIIRPQWYTSDANLDDIRMPSAADPPVSLAPPGWVQRQRVMPLASSEGLGWKSLVVYRFRYPSQDRLEIPSAGGHFVSAHMNCPCELNAHWDGVSRKSRSIPGDAIILGAHQPVVWDWRGEFEEVQMFIDPRRLEAAAAQISDRPFSLIEGISIQDPFIYTIARRILEELTQAPAGTACFADVIADTLIWHLLRTHSTLSQARARAIERIDMPAHKVRMALEFMISHAAQDISVDDIAAAVSISSSRFARGFKKATGQSPHQFLIGRRIEMAQDLLRSTDQRLADIARAVGFATQSQFTVAFRRRCQITPGRYREKHTH